MPPCIQIIRALTAVAVAASVTSCQERITVRFDPPGPYCAALVFPARWTFPPLPETEMPNSAHTVVFRKLRDRGDWIIIAATDFHWDPVTSTNFWKLDLSRLSALAPATAEEWTHGLPISVQTTDAHLLGETETFDRLQAVPFEGRQFPFVGHRLHGAHPTPASPANRWIAVQSYDGKDDRYFAASDGNYFIEVFETGSAKKLFQISGEFHDSYGASIMGETGWLEDHYLVTYSIPIVNRLVICDVLKAGK